MCASTNPGIRMLSPCSTTCVSVGRVGSSSRAGPSAAMHPSSVTSRPSSKNSKLPGSSCGPGSERKCRIAPRCAHGFTVMSVRSATFDPGEHFGSLLLGDAGNVSRGHGTCGDLLTYLLGARQDARGCVKQHAVGGCSKSRLRRFCRVTAGAPPGHDRLDVDEAPGGRESGGGAFGAASLR